MPLETKLALKGRAIQVLDAPEGFKLNAVGTREEPALLVFVKGRTELRAHQTRIVRSARADRLTWVAYPKGGQLGTDLNRDSLAELLLDQGIQPVTQVSIDEVWSALRFRPSVRPSDGKTRTAPVR